MSVFKSFITSDVIVSPFEVNKSFTFQGISQITGSGIDLFEGYNNTSLPWISGSFPTGYITQQNQVLIYNSIKELYYSNYIENINGSPAGTASFNIDGTITGPSYTPSYYNYLSNTLPPNRYFPTQSEALIGVISIPSNLFGEYIKPGTFYFAGDSSIGYGPLTDDGEGNLISGSNKYGDIIYEHGIVIITNLEWWEAQYPLYVSSFEISFSSSLTIYETQYKCTLRENEFNFSTNPTQISGSSNSGVLYDFATGSFFTPYATTVGLYDNNYNLLAVAKLAQPLPLSSVTDTSIIVNLDL
jgi:hypothetical protein